MKLYELTNELASILENEELTEDVGWHLEQVEMAFEKKVEGCLQFRAGLEAEAAAAEEEAKRLKARADSFRKRADWLKSYVAWAMQTTGVQKVSTPIFSASLCKSPLKVVLAEGEEIPKAFAKEEVKVSLDKKAVLEAWNNGIELPHGLTVVQEQHLRIS